MKTVPINSIRLQTHFCVALAMVAIMAGHASGQGSSATQLYWTGAATGSAFDNAENWIDESTGNTAADAPDAATNILLDERFASTAEQSQGFTVVQLNGIQQANSVRVESSYRAIGGGTLELGGPLEISGFLELGTFNGDATATSVDLTAGGASGDLTLESTGSLRLQRGNLIANDVILQRADNAAASLSLSNASRLESETLEIGSGNIVSLTNSASIDVISPVEIAGTVSTLTGTLTAPSFEITESGFLAGRQSSLGEASIVGDLSNSGSVHLGINNGNSFQESGRILLDGNYQQEEIGRIIFGLNSSSTNGIVDDQLLVTGDVELAGALDFSVGDELETQLGDQFLLIDVGGNLSGVFDLFDEGASIHVDSESGFDFRITYAAGDGNDVAVNVFAASIPEPSSLSLIAVAFTCTLLTRKRNL